MTTIANEQELNMIRGKMLVGVATTKELHTFLNYVSALEALVIEASLEDFYGTEGYEKRLGWA